jgi:uncharacterized lipoprotein YddW (UPF0748 family)
VGEAFADEDYGVTLAPLTPPAKPYVLVIKGTNLGPDGQSYVGDVNDAYAAVTEALDRAGLPYHGSTDGEVAQGLEDLTLPAAIILPYNRALTPAEVNLLTRAAKKGVHLLVFLTTSDPLAQLLGVKLGTAERMSAACPVAPLSLRCDPINLPGLPDALTVSASFWRPFTRLEGRANTVAWREPLPGQTEPPLAITLNDTGLFFAFAPASGSAPALATLLWALLGKVAPQVMSDALPRNAKELGPFGPYGSLADMLDAWRTDPAGAPPGAWDLAKRAEARLYDAADTLSQGHLPEAMTQVTEARRLGLLAYWAILPSRAPEIRGVWAYPSASPDWDTALARLAAANFNVVFPYVASAGAAWYPSGILPRAADSTHDSLAELCAAGKKYGVEIHPRILALECLFTDPQVKADLAKAGRLEVNSQGETTDWLCPTDPRNQEQLLGVATEIATHYPVQGIQLDYFRYDDTDACLCPTCRAAFEKYLGHPVAHWPDDVVLGDLKDKFLEWRQGVLTDLLAALRAQLKALRPDLKLSVAVFPNWQTSGRNFGQDPVTWAQRGLVDFLCPMTYTADLGRFSDLTKAQVRALDGQVPLAAGIGAFSDACKFAKPEDLSDQIQASRQAGAQGFVVFNYNDRFVNDFLPWIEVGLTSRPSPFAWKK